MRCFVFIVKNFYRLLTWVLISVFALLISANAHSQNIDVADILGWVQTGCGRCGGFYFEPPISTTESTQHPDAITVTSEAGTYSFRGTSIGQGKVTISRLGQKITTDKAYLFRDKQTGKLNAIELVGNVRLHEPTSLLIAKKGRYEVNTKHQCLFNILYRSVIYADKSRYTLKPSIENLTRAQYITQLTAWGQADAYRQTQPKIFIFENATYTTCPPTTSVWRVHAGHIELNKITGRGSARNAYLTLKGVPVFYTPYINFPIDSRRQTGFLWPMFGLVNGKFGPYVALPFYWNMAPNYDMTITPTFMSKRGLLVADFFRYLSPTSNGRVNFSILPHDKAFAQFKRTSFNKYSTSTDPVVQANLRRLKHANLNRLGLSWQDETRFNDHWFSHIDYNQVSDDYFLQDLRSNIYEVTQNQLLQLADITYKGQYWNFLGRIQGYQTLHPLDVGVFENQYTRLPQLILNGNYPDDHYGFEYFVSNELTHFNVLSTPGLSKKMPMGNRLHVQPGISRPINYPYFYFIPRLQFAMTQYQLGDVANQNNPNAQRALPIFDINSGINLDRHLTIYNRPFKQTLEPQIYYTYIPYRNQNQLPLFDTTINMLTYDQLFVYNRFSGLDRIGDANQISVGVATRVIDDISGLERMYAGVGQIYYFRDRLVTLCQNSEINGIEVNCPDNPDNHRRASPLSGTVKLNICPNWNFNSQSIYNPLTNKLDNQTFGLQYQTDLRHVFNFGYIFVRGGDTLLERNSNPSNNLSQTDLSFALPISRDWSSVGRWTQNLNRHRFQNLLFGLQYDACCWAVRVVAGRTFNRINASGSYQYNPELFVQFALKGLGNLGSGDPGQFLSSNIKGYQSQFGQDF